MRYLICVSAAALIFAGTVSAQNTPYEQASSAGVKKCLPAVQKLTSFAIDDGDAGAHSMWGTKNADTTGFSTAIERNYQDGPVLVNVVVVPAADGRCYGEYVKVFNSDKSCMSTLGDMKGASVKSEVNREITLVEHGAVSVYLMPNGSQNCTVVRKEVMLNVMD